MSRARWGRMVCLAAVAALPAGRASAYLDPGRFDAPALEGGTEGRAFTGAPADGYGCGVCHRGGVAPALALGGLPPLGYQPGETYEFELAFPADARFASAVLELADGAGHGVGRLMALPEGALTDEDRCGPGGEGATALLPLEGRFVARTSACGARRARVRWTAPSTAVPDLRLFAGLVVSDGSGDPEGDGVAAVAFALPARDAPALETARLSQRCAVSGPGIGAAPLAVWLAALAALVVRSARRRAGGSPGGGRGVRRGGPPRGLEQHAGDLRGVVEVGAMPEPFGLLDAGVGGQVRPEIRERARR